jgi:hypothetical protein
VTFAEAAAAAGGEKVITLLDDIDDPYTLAVGEILKVARNEKALTVKAPEDYVLKISDPDAEGVITYSSVAGVVRLEVHNYNDYSINYNVDGRSGAYETLEEAIDKYFMSSYLKIDDETSVRVRGVLVLLDNAGDVVFPEKLHDGVFVIKNGFSINPTIEGPYILKESSQTNYTYYYTNAANASIVREGVTKYYTLDGAVADVREGETIKFLGNCYSNVTVDNGKTFTIDLNGYEQKGIISLKSGFVTIENGTVTKSVKVYGSADSSQNPGDYNKLILSEDSVLTNGYSVILYNANYSDDGAAYGSQIDIYGTTGTLWVIGTCHEGNSVININDGATVSDTETAIGLNGCATVNVNPGATILGGDEGVAIEVRAGSLNVAGGTISGGTTADASFGQVDSGTTSKNAGIAIAQHSTQLPINVTISGSPVISGSSALYIVNPQDNPDTAGAIAVEIVDTPVFNGKTEIIDNRAEILVSGGKFDTQVRVEDCVVGKIPTTEPDNDGKYTVVNGWKVKFDLNEGTGEGDYSQQNIPTGEKVTKPASDPKLTNQIFDGWYQMIDDEMAETAWNFDEDIPTSDMTLKAGWKYDKVEEVKFSAPKLSERTKTFEDEPVVFATAIKIRRTSDTNFRNL